MVQNRFLLLLNVMRTCSHILKHTLFGRSYSNRFSSNSNAHVVGHPEIRPKSRFIILIVSNPFHEKLLGWEEMVKIHKLYSFHFSHFFFVL